MNRAKHPDHDHAEEWADYYEVIGRVADAAGRFLHQLAAAARRIPGKDDQWTDPGYTQVAESVDSMEREAERMAAAARRAHRAIHARAPRSYQQAMNARSRPITEDDQ